MQAETHAHVANGWIMLCVNVALFLSALAMLFLAIYKLDQPNRNSNQPVVLLIMGLLLLPTTVILMRGHFTLQPNQAKVLILFGEYHGTVRHSGFYWGNPFFVRRLISLRLHNMESARLKVNDRQGNPIEIAAVIVWRVENTAQACFDVDDYTQYVKIQSETAVRHLASQYAYDHIDDQQTDVTLRSGVEEVSRALQSELHDRLDKAGVVVEEARLTHLAYAPEIAGVMLRRQQAEAVIAARQKIVHGAVSMVQMALSELAAKQVIELDEERKAAMVSNLLVVLCGEGEVQPIINAGTLYT